MRKSATESLAQQASSAGQNSLAVQVSQGIKRSCKKVAGAASLMFFGGNVYLTHKQQPTAGMGSGLPIRT